MAGGPDHWRVLVIDLAFLGANSLKILEGGWFPILVGGLIFLLMGTWARGRRLLQAQLSKDSSTLREFLQSLKETPVNRAPGTAVFLGSGPIK